MQSIVDEANFKKNLPDIIYSRDRINKTFHRQGMFLVFTIIVLLSGVLITRLSYLMLYKAEYYGKMAQELHERERAIKAKRGNLYDRNGKIIAGNISGSTISVIHSQITDPEKVIHTLADML